MTTSSSDIKTYTDNCPLALKHKRANVPTDIRQFQPGKVAHAVIQAVRQIAIREKRSMDIEEMRMVGEEIAGRLMHEGGEYRGQREPPIHPDDAITGREIALGWLEWHPPATDGWVEIGLAVDKQGWPVPFGDDEAYYDGILDDLRYEPRHVDDDGISQYSRLILEDHKSAFPTDASWLETVQARGYAVLAWAFASGKGMTVEILERRVNNLRTHRRYEDIVDLTTEQGIETLDRWQRDIFATIHAMELNDGTARPGIGCMGCPYIRHCRDAKAMINYATKESMADVYAVTVAKAKDLEPFIRAMAAEAPVQTAGGTIGYYAEDERIAADDAVQRALAHVPENARQPETLLSMLKLGGGNYTTMSQRLYNQQTAPDDWRERRADFIDEVTKIRQVARFGIVKKEMNDE